MPRISPCAHTNDCTARIAPGRALGVKRTCGKAAPTRQAREWVPVYSQASIAGWMDDGFGVAYHLL